MFKKNSVLIIVLVVVLVFLLVFNIIIGNKHFNKNLNDITVEFKNYLESTYNIDVSDYYRINTCDKAIDDCDYFGIFTLEDDLSYRIRIEKKGDNYKTSYEKDALEMRKELYEYASKLKNGNLGKNYLEYENKDNGFSSLDSNDTDLEYVVYTNNNEITEEDMQTDFLIVSKANEILKKYNIKDGMVSDVDIMYTKNNIVLNDKWIRDAYQDKSLDDLANLNPDYNYEYSFKYYEGMNFETFKRTVKSKMFYR